MRNAPPLAKLPAVFLILALSLFPALAAEDPVAAPMSPRFLQYMQNSLAGRTPLQTEEGHRLGYIPPPFELPVPEKTARIQSDPLQPLPESFDLRVQGRVTSVKDQGNCGSCWAFATHGAMESLLLPGETWNFSENHLKNTHGYDWTCCDGGNHLMALAYLARWSGPVNESDDPYSYSCESPSGLTVLKHMQDAHLIPYRADPLDNDSIKRAVMEYGAVFTSMYWSSEYYKPSTYAYYFPGGAYGNHAICIVGWDDNFPASRFSIVPPGNGAFIMKNSWGTGWGQNGYFYISYYDTRAFVDSMCFDQVDAPTNYDWAHAHDWLGWTSSCGYYADTAWFANIFISQVAERLQAVGFYTAVPNSEYEIQIHRSPTSGPINSAGPVHVQSGIHEKAGYRTVVLSSPVTLLQGERFSVVVKLTTPGYEYPIPMEAPYYNYSSQAEAVPGQSFVSDAGISWVDMTSAFANTNVCVRAYMTGLTGLNVEPEDFLQASGPTGGPFSPTNKAYTLGNTGTTTIEWNASNNQPWVTVNPTSGVIPRGGSAQVTVSINSTATSLPRGTYNDAVTFTNTSYGAGSTTRSVQLIVQDGLLAAFPGEPLVTAGEQGGPFLPEGKTYTIANAGFGNLHWAASKTGDWITVSPNNGFLAQGESTDVTINVGPAAGSLPEGEYTDLVTFSNLLDGSNITVRDVDLTVAPQYLMEWAPYEWIEPTGHTPISLSDNGVSSAKTIPFSFHFYGRAYSQLYVGANGLIGFSELGLSAHENVALPSRELPNAVLYPYWDDLHPENGGSVYFGIEGESPNRRAVISYVGVQTVSSSPLTFQALLCEGTNEIVFQYKDVRPADMTYGAGRSATVGIENHVGFMGRQHSFDGSKTLANEQAIVFTLVRGMSIAETKRQPRSNRVILRGRTVTTAVSSLLYIEEEDRSIGMLVYKPLHNIIPGQKVDLVGEILLGSTGEKAIKAYAIGVTGSGSIRPLFMSNRELAGADWQYDPETGEGQQGIEGCIYPNNIGLFIQTAGRVTHVDDEFFYIDDGSGLQDGSGYRGVRVLARHISLPPLNSFVVVRGASSCFKVDGIVQRQVRIGSAEDIRIYD